MINRIFDYKYNDCLENVTQNPIYIKVLLICVIYILHNEIINFLTEQVVFIKKQKHVAFCAVNSQYGPLRLAFKVFIGPYQVVMIQYSNGPV